MLLIVENPSNIDYENIYDEGQGRPGPAEGGPDLEGQVQGRQNWLRAGPDRPVDSLELQKPVETKMQDY